MRCARVIRLNGSLRYIAKPGRRRSYCCRPLAKAVGLSRSLRRPASRSSAVDVPGEKSGVCLGWGIAERPTTRAHQAKRPAGSWIWVDGGVSRQQRFVVCRHRWPSRSLC